MTADMFNKLLAQVPDIVSAIAEWNGVDGNGYTRQKYSLIVREYTPSGTWFSQDCFLIDEDEFLDHIERVKKRPDCSFDLITDEKVIVRRTLKNGDYYLAEYKPARGAN